MIKPNYLPSCNQKPVHAKGIISILLLATCLQITAQEQLSVQKTPASSSGMQIALNINAHNGDRYNYTTDALLETRITGKVTSETGEALTGVSVSVKGSTAGTSTSKEGNYAITVPDNATLVFSSVGFESREVSTAGQTVINVALTRVVAALEQVVVVGYGTQRRRDLTGAVASVKGEELAKQPVQTATQALQGKTAGVQIISSGQPNSQPVVRIRGTGTMLAGADPLYVVDGNLTTDIRNINNSDIVSVEVLKDASAAAIYGMRAGNGVIIITTKQGKTGKAQVSYNGNIGFRQAAHKVKMANADQYLDYLKDAAPTANFPAGNGTTDWFGAILRNAFEQSHNLSVSGGTDAVKYYFSAGYFGDEGIIRTNKFERMTIRSNNIYTISPKLKLNSQISFTQGNTQDIASGVLSGVYNGAYRANPLVPAKIGSKYGNTSAFGNVGNPLLSLDKNDNRLLQNRLQGNFSIDYAPFSFLKLRSAGNADMSFDNRREYGYQFASDTTIFTVAGGNQRRDQSQLDITRNNSTRLIWDNTATFAQRFNRHDVSLLGGVLAERYTSESVTGERRNVPASRDLWYLNVGDPNSAVNGNSGELIKRLSYIARLNYGFDQKYLLTASLRYEGTSLFSKDNRHLASPAIGAAWVISKEDFMNNQKFFQFLKVRASWGRVANDQIASSSFINTLSSNQLYYFGGQPYLGTALEEIKDKNLKFEISEESDLGLEFTSMHGKLTGEVTYYDKKTKDALVNVTIPGILGDPDQISVTNAASFSNKGLEVNLGWRDRLSAGLSYNISGNITFNTNKVIGLNQGQPLRAGGVGQQSFTTYSTNNQPIGSFYVLQALGVFQTQDEVNNYKSKNGLVIQPDAHPGDLKYLDADGDGKIDQTNDRVFAGSYQPKFYYGINTGLTYKGFDISADFFGNAGNKVYNGKKAFRYETTDNIEASYANKRWKANRPSQTDPSTIQSNTPASTYFIESGAFFRLNNFTVGYTLAKGVSHIVGISSVRVYVTSQNLFTATRYSGFTPELPAGPLDSGIETNAYPTTRTFAFGLNVTF